MSDLEGTLDLRRAKNARSVRLLDSMDALSFHPDRAPNKDPSQYLTSYIIESSMGLSLATLIGLPLASFSLFFTLANYGLSPPRSNFSFILKYLSYELRVNYLSTYVAAGL